MKDILKNYFEWIAGAASVILFGVVVWILIWSVLIVGKSMNSAFGILPQDPNGYHFNIDKAQKLDYKGSNL